MDKIKKLWNTFVTSLKENKDFRLKTIIIAAVAVVVIVGIIIACVCIGGNGEPSGGTEPSTQGTNPSATNPPDGMIDYSVTVLDAKGNPVPGVIVNFIQNGATAAMQQTNEQGIAMKNLAAGDYTIELAFTDSDAAFSYDMDAAVVSVSSSSLTIVLYNALGDETKNLSAYSAAEDAHKDYTAYYVTVGSTQVTLDPVDRSYFIFVPNVDGIYEFSTDKSTVTVGYYGSTYYVQANNLAETTETGSITSDIAPGMINLDGAGTSALVIGLDGNGESECVLTIERIGDHVKTLDEYPWDVYEATVELNKYTLPEGTKLTDFDITADSDAYTLVLNETDGFYHLGTADGPLVYVKLGVDSAYLSSFKTILDNTDISRYFFDEDGNYVSKENYTDCMLEYIRFMDENAGVYPLTEDLKYIIQQHGDYVGWWDVESPTFIFYDSNGNPIVGLNPDIAWLFACCYAEDTEVETEPTEPESTEPEETQPQESEPEETRPVETEPEETEPEETKPEETKPEETEPEQTEPEETKPVETEPEETEPEETEPEETEPEETEPEDEKKIGTPTLDEDGNELVVMTMPFEKFGEYEFDGETFNNAIIVNAGEYVRYEFFNMSEKRTLHVNCADAYVIYNKVTYWADENGEISIELEPPKIFGGSITVYFGNAGAETQDLNVTMTTKVGSMSNPKVVALDSKNQAKLTIRLSSDDAQGYWCTYTATADGTFNVKLNSDINAEIMLTNNSTYEQVLLSECDGDTVSIAVEKGDVISITVSVAATSGSGSNFDVDYESATIKITASLK